jgi:hypothetical protein
MIQTTIIKSLNGKKDLIETSTTSPESKKLLQVETNITYFDRVIDIIINGKSKYSYKEIDKTQEDLDNDKKLLEMKNEMEGN